MNAQDKADVEKLFKELMKNDFSKRIGDTPTDSLQLANKKYVDNKSSGGLAINGVASTPFPPGWTVSRTAQGTYLINHTLNTSRYSVVATVFGASATIATVNNRGGSNFVINTWTTAGAATDANVFFLVTLSSISLV